MTTEKPTLLILVGPPGSGKTHIAERFSKRNNYVHINSDSVRAKYFPSPDFSADERIRVYIKIHEVITERLTQGRSVVFDGNLLTNKDRLEAFNHYTGLGNRVRFVFLNVLQEVAIKRALSRKTSEDGLYNAMPEERAVRMHAAFEKPSTSLPQVIINNTDYFEEVNASILKSLES